MTSRKLRGPYAKGIERRNQILERAMEVFAERGSAKMSLSAVAEQLGVTHAAVAHHFGSVEELLLEVLRKSDDDGRALVRAHHARTLREQLHLGAERNTTVGGVMALYTTMLAASIEPNNAMSREFFARRFDEGREALAAAITRGRADGVTPEGPDPYALATLIIATFDGLQVQRLLSPDVALPEVLGLLDAFIGDAEIALADEPTPSLAPPA